MDMPRTPPSTSSDGWQRTERVWRMILVGWRRFVRLCQQFAVLWGRFEHWWQRFSGYLLLTGGVVAASGWLTVSVSRDPLSRAWTGGVWAVILGALLVLMGMMGLYAQHALRAGMIGLYGLLFLFGGTVLLIAGAGVVDLVLLPKLFAAVSKVPSLTAQLQNVVNGASQGINTATNSVTSGGIGACNAVGSFFGAGSCSSAPPPTSPVPSVTIPPVNGPTLVNGLLGLMGLPTLAALGGLGLALLSGAFLAPGCLALAAALLWAGFHPRWPMLALMGVSVLSLLTLLGLKLPLIGASGGVLFYVAVAGFGALLSFPGRWRLALPDHLLPTAQLAGLAHGTLALGHSAVHAVQSAPGIGHDVQHDDQPAQSAEPTLSPQMAHVAQTSQAQTAQIAPTAQPPGPMDSLEPMETTQLAQPVQTTQAAPVTESTDDLPGEATVIATVHRPVGRPSRASSGEGSGYSEVQESQPRPQGQQGQQGEQGSDASAQNADTNMGNSGR